MADETQPTKKANPAPLGLLGFGMTTVLLSLHNADVLALDGVTLAMGIFVGGLAQVIAGLMEYKNGNTFGTVAFTLYGMFWLTFVATHTGIEGMSGSGDTLGTWLLLWGILTLFLFVGTLKGRKSLMFVFATLTITFFLLAAGNLGGVDGLLVAGGAVGVVCGLADWPLCTPRSRRSWRSSTEGSSSRSEVQNAPRGPLPLLLLPANRQQM